MNALEMATRDELLEELKSRYDELVVIARGSLTEDTENRFMFFKGSPAAAYGNTKKLELHFESLLRSECIEEIAMQAQEDDDADFD